LAKTQTVLNGLFYFPKTNIYSPGFRLFG